MDADIRGHPSNMRHTSKDADIRGHPSNMRHTSKDVEKRKRLLQVEKDRKKAFDERAKLKEKKRLRKMQQRKVR